MLTDLYIRDFAIVDELEIEIGDGMTALTGETGAGKSILLDALGLVLGDRADNSSIRAGRERAEITAGFDVSALDHIREWLTEQELEGDAADCILRRVVSADGRSRAYINGRPTTLALMRELGEQLVDIHGQNEHQSLRRREAQRALLDDFGEHDSLLAATRRATGDWRAACEALARLGGSPEERAQRADYLRYQINELDSLAMTANELSELDAEHRQLANAGRLLEACETALTALYDGETAAHTQLSRAAGEIDSIAEFDDALREAGELINAATIQADEATSTLRSCRDRLDLDPARLEWVEQRLAAIHELARKHHVEPEGLPELHERLATELETLEHADEHSARCEQAVEQARAAYNDAAAALTEARRTTAERLAESVTAAMQELGMSGGSFTVDIEAHRDSDPSATGSDRVEFLVCTNPGQPAAPLRRIASGGELSRISLAIQMIASNRAGIPTQIFDEVDAGIGGRVAATVGNQLATLGNTRQVLCVTHLAQVAAAAHRHLQVSKQTRKGHVTTTLKALTADERVEEIARMLGGHELTERSREHARELLAG